MNMKIFLSAALVCTMYITIQSGRAGTVPEMTSGEPGRTFVINVCMTDLAAFTALAHDAAVLKKYGRVQINVSTLSDKSFYEIPAGGNPWNEYASNNPTLAKFFPDAAIAPYLPAEFVLKNRNMMIAKAKILRDNGMEAAFFGNEPGFLPPAFFAAHPALRGPRVDHPRRSRLACFSPCMSTKEMQNIYSRMANEMLKQVPEMHTFYFKTNDAGSGNCWSDWLYSGPNGPAACREATTGERLAELMGAIQEGSRRAGVPLDIYLSHPQGSSNFSETERADIENNLPEHCHFSNTTKHPTVSLGSEMADLYPVLGIGDIADFVEELKKLDPAQPYTVFINFNSFYNRGNESKALIKICFDMLDRYLSDPAQFVPAQALQQYCSEWVGPAEAARLNRAFTALNKALLFKRSTFNLAGIYWSVSSRTINRPLVAVPQRLSPKEEAYFLPHVFNVSTEEARNDYLDIHGGRWTQPVDTLRQYVKMIGSVASVLDSISPDAIKSDFVRKLGPALRVHASLVRSVANFTETQYLRDRNAEKLNGPVHRPSKEATWTGDRDILALNALMRDELDNTAELSALLRGPAKGVLCLAADKQHEDCFLLGPDLVETLDRKYAIMIDHWRDIEDYMTTPFK